MTVTEMEIKIGDYCGVPVTLHASLIPELGIPRVCPYCGGRDLAPEGWVMTCRTCGVLISRLNDSITI
jgi:hypothetical protein